MARMRRPTTDSGTVVLHLLLVVSFVALVMTGLRIASDDPTERWLRALDAILPIEDLWFRHLLAAAVLIATAAGYVIYMVQARLTPRVRLDRPRLAGLWRRGTARWTGLHAIAYWGLVLSLAAEVGTGIALFFGSGAPYLTWHLWAAWACLGFVALHIGLQATIGGVAQLTRIVRPAPLIVAVPVPDLAGLLAEQLSRNQKIQARNQTSQTDIEKGRAKASSPTTLFVHPAGTLCAILFVTAALAVEAERATRPELRIAEISTSEAPILDGDLSDPVWRKATPVSVLTTQGGDFGGGGESIVEIRAVHDDEFAYFAFTWSDPTRSLKHMPLIKARDGWHVAQTAGHRGEAALFHEDKFAVLLARSAFPLIGAAIHLTRWTPGNLPSGATGRGLHYTRGDIVDVWVWRASHQGANGHIDNCHIGAPARPTAEQSDGRARYRGGFARDPGPPAYRNNADLTALTSVQKIVVPWRLPRDVAATARALGRVSESAEQSESEGARWWMTEAESMPYSRAIDSQIPPDTIIPGIVMHDLTPESRTSVHGVAKWAAGRWTLELSRRLNTGSPYDIPIKSGILLWVAAFDHSETRHTRHLRPFRLEIE